MAATPALRFRVEMTLPRLAVEVRDRLAEELHRRDRRVDVIHLDDGHGARFAVATDADDAPSATAHALQLMAAALEAAGLGEAAVEAVLEGVVKVPPPPGGPRLTDEKPALDYRSATLPAGRVVHAASSGPAGEWFAFIEGEPERVMTGRIVGEVVYELLELEWGEGWEPWFEEALAALAGHQTPEGVRYQCPCCESPMLIEPPGGTYEICEVCGWEDDLVQLRDPDLPGGANSVSLREARERYRARG